MEGSKTAGWVAMEAMHWKGALQDGRRRCSEGGVAMDPPPSRKKTEALQDGRSGAMHVCTHTCTAQGIFRNRCLATSVQSGVAGCCSLELFNATRFIPPAVLYTVRIRFIVIGNPRTIAAANRTLPSCAHRTNRSCEKLRNTDQHMTGN